jgi:hypothetical protein
MKQITAIFLLLSWIPSVHAVDIDKLIQDTQRLTQGSTELVLVWWIPTEFWEATLAADPSVSEAQRSEFTKALDEYLVFAVVAADIGPMGGVKPRSRNTLLKHTELRIGGVVQELIPSEDVSGDAANFVAVMKPMMANMMGQFGKGMEFFLYANGTHGKRLIKASEKGDLAFSAFGTDHTWRLPLASLLPPKIDPKTNEVFPGDYLFNPFTGTKLVDQ